MDLHLDIPQGHFFVRSVSVNGIVINDDVYATPLILSAQQINPDWDVEAFADLNEENLQVIIEMQPEVVLIGCGKIQLFLPPALQAFFLSRHIGVEVMLTDAACRTFNVLASEGRNVVAALL